VLGGEDATTGAGGAGGAVGRWPLGASLRRRSSSEGRPPPGSGAEGGGEPGDAPAVGEPARPGLRFASRHVGVWVSTSADVGYEDAVTDEVVMPAAHEQVEE